MDKGELPMMTVFRAAALLLALAVSCGSACAASIFQTIDYPGAQATYANGINDLGTIVGEYFAADGRRHGYILRDGQYTTIDFPGSVRTTLFGINNDGTVVGEYCMSACPDESGLGERGFSYSDGQFTYFDFPIAVTVPRDISNNGIIVGYGSGPGQLWDTYVGTPGSFTALNLGPYHYGLGINIHGTIVGTSAAEDRAFIVSDGNLQILTQGDCGTRSCHATGINDGGTIVGFLGSNDGPADSFILSGAGMTIIDHPAIAIGTNAGHINNFNQVVGYYQDTANKTHGFFWHSLPFAGIPGHANCGGQTESGLAHQYGSVSNAATVLGYQTTQALENDITAYCQK